ncbi:MAG: hypothetical protein WDW38_008363 [Sanguina aurantia]
MIGRTRLLPLSSPPAIPLQLGPVTPTLSVAVVGHDNGTEDLFRDIDKEVNEWSAERSKGAKSSRPKSLWEEIEGLGEELFDFLEGTDEEDGRTSGSNSSRNSSGGGSSGASSSAASSKSSDSSNGYRSSPSAPSSSQSTATPPPQKPKPR